jgi:flavin reductase (DIM6/NTAB) family NADH-FMN oxidoreductase RutF
MRWVRLEVHFMESSEYLTLTRRLDPPLWVVTATDGRHAGGLLATFVNPASIVSEMPRMLVGIARQHRTWDLIEASGSFALHLLREEHLDWATRFGLESSRSVDKLAGLEHRAGASGSPILNGAAGWLDCRVEDRLETGDRTVYLAEVLDARAPTEAPLLTVHRWLRLLPADQLARVGEQLARDAALDADLIRVWRRARS